MGWDAITVTSCYYFNARSFLTPAMKTRNRWTLIWMGNMKVDNSANCCVMIREFISRTQFWSRFDGYWMLYNETLPMSSFAQPNRVYRVCKISEKVVYLQDIKQCQWKGRLLLGSNQ